jgi:hypothetical protein
VSNYIQVNLKVIEVLSPMVARAAAISEDRALAGLVRLWHRCWSTTSDTLTITQLAGVFGAERIDAIAEALCGDFLERTPEGFRVRGSDAYLRLKASRAAGAAKTNARRWGGRSESPIGRSPPISVSLSDRSATGERSLPVALPPNTEHRTPNTEKKKSPPKLPGDPRHQPLVDAIDLAFQAQHGRRYPFEPRDFARIKALLPRGTSEELVEAWRRALANASFPTIATIEDFAKHLPRFVGTGPPNVVDLRKPVPPAQFTESKAVENF